MTAYAWPTGRAHVPSSVVWGTRSNALTSASPLNGAVQRVAVPGTRWSLVVQMSAQRRADRQALMAYLAKVGADNLVTLHDVSNPLPRGTCNLSGVTASAAAAFATSLTLNGCGAGATLLAGDKISVAIAGGLTQLVMVTDDATANGSGVMAVSFRSMLRGAVSAGAAVVLSSPTTHWRLADPDVASTWMPGSSGPYAAPMTIELVEDFA